MYWYEDEVKRIEKEKHSLTYRPGMIFYGSSSIRLWNNLTNDFHMFAPVNLGFGGSTLEACVWFFNRIMYDYSPDHIVIYAGDNDLGDGKKPQEVFSCFKQLSVCIKEKFDSVSVTYISIKPSLARWNINHLISDTNHLIKDSIAKENRDFFFVDVYEKMVDKNGYPVKTLYDADGLHLSAEGYSLWKGILLTHFSSNNDIFVTQYS